MSQFVETSVWRDDLESVTGRGRVVNTLASYSGGSGIYSRSGDSYPDWGFSRFSLVPAGEGHDSTLN
jgi:hypothetical protein